LEFEKCFFEKQNIFARCTFEKLVHVMGKRAPGNKNTREGVKGTEVRTISDDAGGKCVSEKLSPRVENV
jgi:hypothetical protein